MRRKWIPDRAIEGPEVGGDGDGGRGGMGAVGCVVPAQGRWRAAQVREDLVIGAETAEKEGTEGKVSVILNVWGCCCFLDRGGTKGFSARSELLRHLCKPFYPFKSTGHTLFCP